MFVYGHDFDSFRRRGPNIAKTLYAATTNYNGSTFVFSACIFLMCFRFFKYFRLSPKFWLLWDSLAAAVKVIAPMLLVFVAFIIAFTCSGHWLFGQHIRVFSSIS